MLINQFKFFFNLFFLLIALTQFIPYLKVGFLFTYVAPLVFVLLVTMMKEAWDDIKRYMRDKEINEKTYGLLNDSGNFTDIRSEQISVGDIIKVNQNERVPADMVLLYTTEVEDANIFIRTDQLDGETDWKLRKSIGYTQQFFQQDMQLRSLKSSFIIAEPPSALIYNFKGKFTKEEGSDSQDDERLTLEHTLWANTVLASTGYAIGLIVYTGKETRSQMNSKSPISKVGLIDLEINFLSKVLFLLMIVISAIIVILNGFHGSWYIFFFRFILLLSSIIPISLRVNLDLAKIWYSWLISKDTAINGTIPRNSTIPEELGRIQYLLSDKTGTLTKNDMEFKKLALEYTTFTSDTMGDVESIIETNCANQELPATDVYEKLCANGNINENGDSGMYNSKSQYSLKRRGRRDQNFVIRDLVTALAVCHNVTPVENNNGDRELQASSPDEVALVKFVEELGYELVKRDQKNIIIKNIRNVQEEYKILQCFPFSSETKRMGIIVQCSNDMILFYSKGAEVVMNDIVRAQQRSFLQEKCEDLAREGLRTLVIGQKVLTKEEYEEWNQRYNSAQRDFDHGDRLSAEVRADLESNLECLGVTGVEDKLQDDVEQTISSLRNAGIQVWMLTGDKVETATCISISTGLKNRSQKHYFMKEMKNSNEVFQKLQELDRNTSNSCLMIDGNTLDICLSDKELEQQFFDVS